MFWLHISSWDYQLPTKLLMLNASRNIPLRTKAYFRDVTLTKKHWWTTKQNLVKWLFCYNIAFCLSISYHRELKKSHHCSFPKYSSANLGYKKAVIKKVLNFVFLFVLSLRYYTWIKRNFRSSVLIDGFENVLIFYSICFYLKTYWSEVYLRHSKKHPKTYYIHIIPKDTSLLPDSKIRLHFYSFHVQL